MNEVETPLRAEFAREDIIDGITCSRTQRLQEWARPAPIESVIRSCYDGKWD